VSSKSRSDRRDKKIIKVVGMASHSDITTARMQVMFYQQTATQIQQHKMSHVSGRIGGQAYKDGRAMILDHYLCVTDRYGNLSLTMGRLERMRSFGLFLGQQEVREEEQRMWRQSRHLSRVPVGPFPLPPGVFGLPSPHPESIKFTPPPRPPAAATPQLRKFYEAILPGTSSVTKMVGMTQLERFVRSRDY
jgi:hypothetical protein